MSHRNMNIKCEPMITLNMSENDLDLDEVITILGVQCRLCMIMIQQESAIHIFDPDRDVAEKISLCLPILVLPTDKYSKYICTICSEHLDLCHDLIIKCTQAETLFRNQQEEMLNSNINDLIEADLEKNHNDTDQNEFNIDGPIICDICGHKKFTDMDTFDEHMENIHNASHHQHNIDIMKDLKQHHQCSACEAKFNSEEERIFHQSTHVDLICKACSQFHSTAQALQRHTCPNAKSEFCRCSLCDKEFTNEFDLKTHEKEVHVPMVWDNEMFSDETENTNDPDTHQCSKCKKKFLNPARLTKHIGVCHVTESIECKVCDMKFSTYGALIKHRRTHAKSKTTLNCNLCDITYRKTSDLLRHLRDSHNISSENQQPFYCRFCNKKLKSKLSLSIHERVHTGQRPFHCEVCKSGFRSKANLLQHSLIHTGVRNHECNICGKAFSRRSFVRTHMRVHTGDRPYSCNVCEARFTQVGDMRRHRKKHTKDEQNERIKMNKTISGLFDIQGEQDEEINVIEIQIPGEGVSPITLY